MYPVESEKKLLETPLIMNWLSARTSRKVNLQLRKEILLKKYHDSIIQEVDKIYQDIDVNN